MGLFDDLKASTKKAGQAAKEKYTEERQKSAALKQIRGKNLATLRCQYAGGYGDVKPGAGLITFYENRVVFKAGLGKSLIEIDTSSIKDVAIEGRHEVNRRVTVTRLLAVGIFAFALKKKQEEKEAFLTIVLKDGQEVVLQIQGKTPLQLKKTLASTLSKIKLAASNVYISESKTLNTVEGIDDVALLKLADLKDKGILTEEEFAAKKKQILGL